MTQDSYLRWWAPRWAALVELRASWTEAERV
jgi:hypothetical protein